MAERHPQFLQVFAIEMRQRPKIDVILGEALGIFPEAQILQPDCDIPCHAAPIPQV